MLELLLAALLVRVRRVVADRKLLAAQAMVERALGARDVLLPLLARDGAEDDVHLLEQAALGLRDEEGKHDHAAELQCT